MMPVTVDPVQTRMVQELKHNSPLISCRIDPSGRFVFAGAQDNTIQRWELATGKELHTFTGHSHVVRSVVFSPDGRTALSGSLDRTLKVWDVATGKELRAFTGQPMSNSEVRNNTSWGVLKLTLWSDRYDWQFIPVSGQSFTDIGSGNCH